MKTCWNCHRQLGDTEASCFACGATASTVNEVRRASELAVGAVIAGRYELVRQLGVGGMGQVWLAQDCVREELVAIKLLSRELGADTDAAAGFKREANVSLKLTHPNIVRLINYEIQPFPYLLMEFVDGRNLHEEMVQRGRGAPAALSLAEVARLLPPLADALDHAHRHGVQHRDIKPSNILLAGPIGSGMPKLADFGIAAELREGVSTGVSGTPEFMPPEMLQRRAVDSRADIYSLGVTIYNLLTGQLPFRTSREVLQATPPPVPGLTMGQQYALSRTLAVDPEERPRSALELCARLGFASTSLSLPVAAVMASAAAGMASVAVASMPARSVPVFADAEPHRAAPISRPDPAPANPAASRPTPPSGSFLSALRTPRPPPPFGLAEDSSPPSTMRAERRERSVLLEREPVEFRATSSPDAIAPGQSYVPRGHALNGPNGQGRLECVSHRDGAVLVLVPAGTFTMGSADGNEDERPAHAVSLPDFWIDRAPVTNRMFETFVRATGHVTTAEQLGKGFAFDGRRFTVAIKGATWRQPQGPTDSISGRSDHPVVQVSWVDAQAYAAWAGRRLPSEVEWERAARGGADGKTYPWGDATPDGRAWFSGAHGRGVQRVGAHPVNGYGLEDMAGNVWEWCEDWYDEAAHARRAAGQAPPAAPSRVRVLRGGAWYVSAPQLRCAYRFKGDPLQASAAQGFRCVLSI